MVSGISWHFVEQLGAWVATNMAVVAVESDRRPFWPEIATCQQQNADISLFGSYRVDSA